MKNFFAALFLLPLLAFAETPPPPPVSFIDSLLQVGRNVSLKNDTATPGANKCYSTNGSGVVGWFSCGSGSGSVSSVALSDGSVTPIYSISGSPVTSTGTLTFTLANQAAHQFFSGPVAGGANEPQFRFVVASDIPTLNQNTTGTAADITASSNTSLTSLVNLVTVGTISTGVWNGTVITPSFGGTGVSALGNLSDAGTDGIIVTGGTGTTINNTSLAQHVSDSTHNGYLSQTDWSTFNSKQSALTIGNLTDAGTDGLIVTGGTGAVVGSGTSLAQHVSDSTHNGYLSQTDWSTFNGKQNALTFPLALSLGGTHADLSATGGTSQVLKQTSVGGNVSVAQLACADLSNSANSCSTTAASTNTASQIVLRDGSGNFASNYATLNSLGVNDSGNTSTLFLKVANNSTPGLTLKNAGSQSGDVFQILNSGGTPLFEWNAANQFLFYNTVGTNGVQANMDMRPVVQTIAANPSGTARYSTYTGDPAALAAGIGGGLSFGFSTNANKDQQPTGFIWVTKNNSTSGDFGSHMFLATLNNTSGKAQKAIELDDSGNEILYGNIQMKGSTSGVVTLQTQATAGTYSMTLPNANASGTLTNNGSGTLSWSAAGSGTVTSVDMTVPAFLSVSGNPITTSGTLALSLSGTALPVANGGTAKTSVTTAPAASSWAGWDANVNMNANAYIPTTQTVAGNGGTTTLTVSSPEITFITGSTGQTVQLPVSSTLALGQHFTIISSLTNVSAPIFVTTSAGTALCSLSGSSASATWMSMTMTAVLTSGTGVASWLCVVDTQVFGDSNNNAIFLKVANGGTGKTSVTTAPAASSWAAWDANLGMESRLYNTDLTSTATAAGTTTMTIASNGIQVWTGATTQTIKLPTTSVKAGATYRFINLSSGSLSIQSSGANAISTVTANTKQDCTALVATPTTAANWSCL